MEPIVLDLGARTVEVVYGEDGTPEIGEFHSQAALPAGFPPIKLRIQGGTLYWRHDPTAVPEIVPDEASKKGSEGTQSQGEQPVPLLAKLRGKANTRAKEKAKGDKTQ